MENNQPQEIAEAQISRALYLPRHGDPYTVNLPIPSSATTAVYQGISYALSPGESLVRVSYSGINPADFKHRALGVWDTVPGYDFAGTIVRTSPGSPFVVGEAVGGTAPAGTLNTRRPAHGAHQDWLVGVDGLMFGLEAISMVQAAGIGIPLRTAIVALYAVLDLPLPWERASLSSPSASSRTSGPQGLEGGILIWGAGSQVGGWAVQLAAASGVTPIYAVAGPKHHDMLKKFGATRCFDYDDPAGMEAGVVQRIVATAKEDGVSLKAAFDAVGLGRGASITALTKETSKSPAATNKPPSKTTPTETTDGAHMAKLCIDILRSLNPPGDHLLSEDPEEHSVSKKPPYRVATALPGGPAEAILVLALPDRDVEFNVEDEGKVLYRQDREVAELVVLVLEWVVRNYGHPCQIPGKLRIMEWNEAADEVIKIAHGTGDGGEKVVINHT